MSDGWDTQIQCQTCDALGRENAQLKAEAEWLNKWIGEILVLLNKDFCMGINDPRLKERD